MKGLGTYRRWKIRQMTDDEFQELLEELTSIKYEKYFPEYVMDKFSYLFDLEKSAKKPTKNYKCYILADLHYVAAAFIGCLLSGLILSFL